MPEESMMLKGAKRTTVGIPKEIPRDVESPKTIPHSFGFRPGVDLDKLNQLTDELEAEATAESLDADSARFRSLRRVNP